MGLGFGLRVLGFRVEFRLSLSLATPNLGYFILFGSSCTRVFIISGNPEQGMTWHCPYCFDRERTHES